MQSSLYLLRLQLCNNTVNNKNSGIKHNSYQRYLMKLRGKTGCNINKKI
jgi:hypothetical protein